MSMFDEIAGKAAAEAMLKSNPFYEEIRQVDMEAALTAAEASLRERGKLRDGGILDCRADKHWVGTTFWTTKDEIPCAIIRIGEP